MNGLAGRYALALLDIAEEKTALDAVAADLAGLKQIVSESEDLQNLLSSPLYTRDQQVKGLSAILDKSGVNDVTRNFVLTVAENRRLAVLTDMADAFLAELTRRRGEIRAQVTAAHELTKTQQKAIADALKSSVGGSVEVDVTVDESLIGGMIVKVGSRMVDSSLRTKLQRLELVMKGVG
ncbi:F0F1 ATP synthase subunit delta [Kiloniella laminariae]|uniref:ATP synthase subunit delta n=1 Tax=Kiloniella laminariae TaxID=454162 RepID=A0ABT4LMY7_9PROT|nr:F0F1 ATP synthase subunit delta [Kiloniella laminariae]MCZ4282452.1 F0F1 ATP synthase subunit delta [Kiloniella laminariae]